MIRSYRKKPVVILAALLDLSNLDAVARWCGGSVLKGHDGVDGINICTLEGSMRALPGDYVICGISGEFYPCKADIFHGSYETARPVDEVDVDDDNREAGGE